MLFIVLLREKGEGLDKRAVEGLEAVLLERLNYVIPRPLIAHRARFSALERIVRQRPEVGEELRRVDLRLSRFVRDIDRLFLRDAARLRNSATRDGIGHEQQSQEAKTPREVKKRSLAQYPIAAPSPLGSAPPVNRAGLPSESYSMVKP